jgi:hypothetical protein
MSDILKRLQKIEMTLSEERLAKVAYAAFKEATPIKTGNAKRSTTLSGNSILAGYPYAGALEAGKSKQAPKGMIEPTIKAIRDYIKKELR